MPRPTPRTPQLLDRGHIVAKAAGWWLPQCGREWASVAEHPPGPGAGTRCWWVPGPLPGGGWWRTPNPDV